MNTGDDMTMSAEQSHALVPAQASDAVALPAIVCRAGPAAVFAAEEFFYGAIRNKNTRAAYKRAVDQFLACCETKGLELPRIAPGDVGKYFDSLREQGLSVATRKLRLSGCRPVLKSRILAGADRFIALKSQIAEACCTQNPDEIMGPLLEPVVDRWYLVQFRLPKPNSTAILLRSTGLLKRVSARYGLYGQRFRLR
jgi:hypothetical protein